LNTTEAVANSNDYESALQAYNANDIETAFIHIRNEIQKNERSIPARILLSEILIKKQYYSSAEQELRDVWAQGADINLIIAPLGKSLLLQGKYDEVIGLTDERRLHSKGKLSFKLLKAKAFTNDYDYVTAEIIYKEVIQEYVQNVEAKVELASIYIFESHYGKSTKLLNEVKEKAENLSRYWQVKGQLASSEKYLEEALNYYQIANELEPNNAWTLRSMARTYVELNDYFKARDIVNSLLTSYPNDIQAQLLNSNIQKLLGEYKLADEVLSKLTNQLSNGDESFMLSKPQLILIDALSSYGQENWLQAKNKFKSYLKQNSDVDDINVVMLLADVYIKAGEPESALELLSNNENKLLNNKDYALILVGLYLQFKKNFKADYVLERLSQQFENDEDILILSAKLLSNTGQDSKALELFKTFQGHKSTKYTHGLGVTLLREGDAESALIYTKSITELVPENVSYQLLHVQVLLQLKEFKQANQIIEDLYKKFPENSQVKFSYAYMQFSLKNTEKARSLFKELVQLSPSDGKSWFVLAQMEYDDGNVQDATAILEQQSKNQQFKSQALYKLTELYYSEQEYKKSLSVVNVLLKLSRLDSKALSMKVKNLIALNDLTEAKGQINILTGLWSRDARNLVKLSRLKLRLGDEVGAEQSLEEAYKLLPSALPVIIEISKVKIRRNKFDEVSKILTKAKSIGFSDNINITLLTADLQSAQGNNRLALMHYSKALNMEPSNVIALVKLYQSYQLQPYSTAFTNQLSTLVENNPEYVLHRHILADYLFNFSKYEQAKFQYQLLLTKSIPNAKRALALNNLSIIYIDNGNFKEAVKTAEQAFTMQPSPAVADTLGWSLVLLGEVERGLALLRQAFSMVSTNTEIQYHIAYALVKLNRVEEAKRLLLDITNQTQNTHENELAKKSLNELEG
jgi:putative PEP-CTERM system TPR-repeat lipoprotein